MISNDGKLIVFFSGQTFHVAHRRMPTQRGCEVTKATVAARAASDARFIDQDRNIVSGCLRPFRRAFSGYAVPTLSLAEKIQRHRALGAQFALVPARSE